MKRLLTLTLLTLCYASSTHAQTATDDYPRVELFGGYSHNRVDTGISVVNNSFRSDIEGRTGFNGFDGSITFNATRRVGFTFNVTGHFQSGRIHPCAFIIPCPPDTGELQVRNSLFNFLGGVRFKDNSRERRVKPFAHILVGVAHINSNFTPNPEDPDPPRCAACFDDTGFAARFDGGLDVRLSRNLDLRVFQLFYNPTRLGDETQHNLGASFGIAVHP